MRPQAESLEPEADRRQWWRTLEERADDPAFGERLHNEFPTLLPGVETIPTRSSAVPS